MKQSGELGQQAEELAARYLVYKGYEILEKRYRCRQGEIDLIARKDGMLIFVEVKYRGSLRTGRPAQAVDRAKQRKIRYTALHYLQQSCQIDQPCRFDVIELWQEEGRRRVHHYRNAFEGERYGI